VRERGTLSFVFRQGASLSVGCLVPVPTLLPAVVAPVPLPAPVPVVATTMITVVIMVMIVVMVPVGTHTEIEDAGYLHDDSLLIELIRGLAFPLSSRRWCSPGLLVSECGWVSLLCGVCAGSSTDGASDYGSEGCRFESYPAHKEL
jgi:hypothetical protein